MAHSSQGSALVGYSDDTELRPLKCAEPIPAGRVCAVCGYIPRATYSLRCGHTLCEPCYDSCVDTSRCVCPLDDEVCATVDVHLRTFPAEYLLTRKRYVLRGVNERQVLLERMIRIPVRPIQHTGDHPALEQSAIRSTCEPSISSPQWAKAFMGNRPAGVQTRVRRRPPPGYYGD
ncbi:hypothetical protein HPB48_017222 [Haemaphysalis longicornis]|uniref:RING-type domain-containing protein n=1 Tax=Haemaphysalis longicornis TaxID=44386 RepID=A0A9J6GII1_HAELO|nr:hypothetical protein HPB48_017222 [Haemaphysalis longicornis]